MEEGGRVSVFKVCCCEGLRSLQGKDIPGEDPESFVEHRVEPRILVKEYRI